MLVAGACLAAACGDSTGPSGYVIELVSGDAQTGMGGWQLEQPVTVVVRDGSGRVRPGVAVHFDTGSGGGAASPASVESDVGGQATTRWMLGSSAPGLQTLTVSAADATTDVQATALAPEQGDVLVVHGALGPLRAAVLTATYNTLESALGAVPSDTVIPLPPLDVAGRSLAVFGHDNSPALVEPAWTPGPDTVHVDLEPPVVLDIAFVVRDGSYATRVTELDAQVERMEDVWSRTGVGVRIGSVTFTDDTGSGPVNGHTPSLCPSSPATRIEVTVLTTIDLGVYWGWACPTGHVFLAGSALSDPQGLYVLAHEVGHFFGLGHRPTGVMQPNGTEASMTTGEAFIMNFASYSGLNTVFGAQPSSVRRECVGLVPGLCPAQGYDLPEE